MTSFLIGLFSFIFRFIPYSGIHALGRFFGLIAYYALPKFRRRTLSNLSLALKLTPQETIKIAKKSMQNLMITVLEYPKLATEKDIHKVAFCENPEVAEGLIKSGQGLIFFCGHQANWEVLFLEGTKRMPGVAIGRPIKNKTLYDWVLSIREKNNGKIIGPINAIREGMKALKKGCFLGIVGDQGMPEYGYCSPFFGINAWTSPIPAILAYRTGCPILFARTLRENGKYRIRYSEPIWPNKEASQLDEVKRMMTESLALLENSIRETPDQWLWQHNRWKQQGVKHVKRLFRYDTILVILPKDPENFKKIEPYLATFREIYPHEMITFLVPKEFENKVFIPGVEKKTYELKQEMFLKEFRFKLIFNLTDEKKIKRHFKNFAASKIVTLPDLEEHAGKYENFSELLKKAIQNAS